MESRDCSGSGSLLFGKRSESKAPGPMAGCALMNLLSEALCVTNREAHQPTMANRKTRKMEMLRMTTRVLRSKPVPIETGGGGPVLLSTGGCPGGRPVGTGAA